MKMKKRVLVVTMAFVLMGSGSALAGGYYGYNPDAGMLSKHGHFYWNTSKSGERRLSGKNWLEKAPQTVKDAVKQIDIKRSEMRLAIAKGNISAPKLRTLHNDMLKARRTISDYYFEQALTKTDGEKRIIDGGGPGWGMHAGSGAHSGLLFELRNELRKDNPDTAKARQIYTEVMNLSEKHAKESFELRLKYPDSFTNETRGRF